MSSEELTDADFARRVGIQPSAWTVWARRGAPRVRTKDGDRRPWPETLHWWIELREKDAKRLVPDSVNQTDFASIVGLTSRTINNLFKEGLPATDDRPRRIKLVEGLRWFIDHHTKDDDEDEDEADLENLRILRAKRQMAEIELAEKRRQVFVVDDVVRELEETFAAVHSAIRELEERIVLKLVGKSTEQEIRPVVHDALRGASAPMIDNVAKWASRAAESLPDIDEEPAPVRATENSA